MGRSRDPFFVVLLALTSSLAQQTTAMRLLIDGRRAYTSNDPDAVVKTIGRTPFCSERQVASSQ